MNPDLDRLIRLQHLESNAEEARRKISEHPGRLQLLDARLTAAREIVSAAKTRLAAAQDRRRTEEKEAATVQTRLARYKDQLLEVKTRKLAWYDGSTWPGVRILAKFAVVNDGIR